MEKAKTNHTQTTSGENVQDDNSILPVWAVMSDTAQGHQIQNRTNTIQSMQSQPSLPKENIEWIANVWKNISHYASLPVQACPLSPFSVPLSTSSSLQSVASSLWSASVPSRPLWPFVFCTTAISPQPIVCVAALRARLLSAWADSSSEMTATPFSVRNTCHGENKCVRTFICHFNLCS